MNVAHAGSKLKTKSFAFGLVANTLLVAAAGVAYYKWPDWMWMYYVDSSTVSFELVLLLFFGLYYVPFFIGFKLPSFFAKLNFMLPMFIIFVILQVLEMVALWNRYAVVGTYEEFHKSAGVSIFDSTLNTFLIVAFAVIVPVTLAMWWFSKKADSKSGSQPSKT